MCGVAAAIGPRAFDQTARMVRDMEYRGLRGRGGTQSGGRDLAIGHVRLPIVGVDRANDQPVRRGPWVIGFVGEVLNFRETNPDYESDVGLVADTWIRDGPEGFRGFDGFWSVVALDQRSNEVHCLVDYLSQKPLYIRYDRYARAVASEPDSLAQLGPVEFDPIYLASVAKWGYCPDTKRTPYLTVSRMTPGMHVVISGEGLRAKVVDRLQPLSLGLADMKSEVEAAVRRRVLSSDVGASALVSGGLDSSIVYTLAKRYGDVKPYHVENGEWGACERVSPGARRVSLGNPDDEKCLDYMQEPIDLGSLRPQVALSDAIRAEGDDIVCLTGDGADEFFGGYGRSLRYDSQASDVWHELVAWHLPRLDRVMMRNRIEVRSPFLARRVAGAALALPWEERKDKIILRDLFRADLPPGVADTPKRALRTAEVEFDREARSRQLIDLFKARAFNAAGRK